ncbi:MAG TPA: hypothetical protein DCQ26_10540 [Marinilabiliales bacterium]|nr:MAG: hypothetical protein A2W95_13685 [Bacteroidetes bacterium GWA2_40_14]OFX59027.1 MAG: hypothetical protein A2W84_00025 [Bacteroidetes bacterium GWC2_40_13]OFX72584.1 MAG: hypothetical protein A2W96_05085 [Bacteroidetes bacterium GWD2_40_43]OFX94128.1 MAG: hypothetical protein A2W97_17525 [Bacteroidetes bacterium GWE2_40_63]OFY20280.1 MAG: hypothetical protein A2W88_12495 [Bacteroidetes bacterium GWF2_40_13]OFZ24571.1 MAG: hypothetical protein A2437_16835 [Bacteroidetes bacterium RIFOXYC
MLVSQIDAENMNMQDARDRFQLHPIAYKRIINVLWYGVVRDNEAISYQLTPTFFTSYKLSQTTEPQLFYIVLCADFY